jgi:hypothetical protein
MYWVVLILLALGVTYVVLFGVAPAVNRYLREFGVRVGALIASEQRLATAHVALHEAAEAEAEPEPFLFAEGPAPEAPKGYSTFDGFKSFSNNGSLTIEDIVKSLSRHAAPAPAPKQPAREVEPIYENVEPVYDHVEPLDAEEANIAPPHIRGFVAALLEGDRMAVFAGLRQHVRGGGSPESLLSNVACLLDDAYRARIDGTPADADIVRLTAKFQTPILEKLVTALTTAIDSSYSTGVTGAKLALTRALGIIGA